MSKKTKQGRLPRKTEGTSQSLRRGRRTNEMTTKNGRVRSRARGRGRAKVLNFRLEPRKKAAPSWMRRVTRPREMTTTRTS